MKFKKKNYEKKIERQGVLLSDGFVDLSEEL